MCFRQRKYSERDYTKLGYRQCTDGKHFNQDCARAYIKQQHFKKRPCKELKLINQIYKFYVSQRTEGFSDSMGDCSQRLRLYLVRVEMRIISEQAQVKAFTDF